MDNFKLAAELRGALDDINAIRRDLQNSSDVSPNVRGPMLSLLERAAVNIENVRIALRTN